MNKMFSDITVGSLLSPLEVVDLAVTGGGVAKYQGQVVFLDQALLGATVSAKVIRIEKRTLHASVCEVIVPSPHIVSSACVHFPQCGGCSWQHLEMQAQHMWKQRHVQETLQRIGKVSVPVAPVTCTNSIPPYRNKMVFAFSQEQGSLSLGLREAQSHTIVPVTNCLVQPPVVMEILKEIRLWLGQHPLPPHTEQEEYLRFLIVHTPDYAPDGQQQILLELITTESTHHAKAVHELLVFLHQKFTLTGAIHSSRRQKSLVAQGEKVVFSVGNTSYKERFGHIILEFPHSAFVQTNTAAAVLLYDLVRQAAQLQGTEVVWDIYCGTGGIGLFVGNNAKQVRGFELQKLAVQAARHNAQRLGMTHCSFSSGRLDVLLQQESTVPDVIILDPPRAGVEPAVLAQLNTLPAKRLIYVSCHMGTQARDIQLLSKNWKVKQAYPVDMFPYTPHVENILLLQKE